MTIRRPSLRHAATLAAVVLALGGLAACGDDDTDTATSGTTPSEDTVDDDSTDDPDAPVSNPDDATSDDGRVDAPDDTGDEFPTQAARDAAKELLGTPEAELGDDVRVSRRGEERFMLTEDYVLGRMTVELDDDGSGTYLVTAVTVELPDGPETFAAS